MKVVFTKHARKKFRFIKELGWNFTSKEIEKRVKNATNVHPVRLGSFVILSPIDNVHELRIVHAKADDIITVVTFYPVEKGRYD